MKTLLDKIKVVEEDATRLLAETQKKGQDKLEAIHTHELEYLQRVRATATREGEELMKEQLIVAKQETEALRQTGINIVEHIKKTAHKNQEQTLDKLRQLFKKEYKLL